MKTKRIHTVIAGLLILAMIGITSCKKEEVVKVFGFVQGFVYDGSNNTVLDNVKVEWQVAGKNDSTTATAADGFKVNNLYSGEYLLKFSKANYSTVQYWVDVPIDDFTGTVRGGANKEYMVSVDPEMYPLNAGLKGRVYKSENSQSIPVEGATVRVEIDNSRIIPGTYETTTDADGYFSFSSLPAVDYVYVRVLEYEDGNGERYNGTYNDYSLISGQTMTINPFTLSQIKDALKLVNTNTWIAPGVATDEFVVSENVVLEFNHDISEAVSKERANSDFPVYMVGGGLTTADYTVTYSGNTVTINPNANLTASTTYTVLYNVYGSQPYAGISSNFSFTTAN